jgi:hypothetical protein
MSPQRSVIGSLFLTVLLVLPAMTGAVCAERHTVEGNLEGCFVATEAVVSDPTSPDRTGKVSARAEMDATTLAAGGTESWWSQVVRNLEQLEYEVSPSGVGLQAPNRHQNLRTYFREDGIDVVARTVSFDEAPWCFGWRTRAWGREGHLESLSHSLLTYEGRRAEYAYACGLTEWYENRQGGLEQGFRIEERPSGEGYLVIAGEYPEGWTIELSSDNQTIDFLDEAGTPMLQYGDLHVWDARGDHVPAWLASCDGSLRIVIDDGESVYPLAIDPVIRSFDLVWAGYGQQNNADYGASVSTAGDVNGDGYSDLIVGAPRYDRGETNEGCAFVYHGSLNGLSSTPNRTLDINSTGAWFGNAVSTAGDVNNDGYGDVIIGAYQYTNDVTAEGGAFVYHGSPSGLATDPAWITEGNQQDAHYGYAVGWAGDVNDDGYSDVIVGAPDYNGPESNEGQASVFLGSESGLDSVAAWANESDQAGAKYGYAVSTAGDVNGDGFSDFIVGAPYYTNIWTDEGRAYVYSGAELSVAPYWTADGGQANAYFGCAVATAGGDSWYSDVIIGAPGFSNPQSAEGAAFVYRGSGTGLGSSPIWVGEGEQIGAQYGASVATAGDVNGDGLYDIIVGAPLYDNPQTDEGMALIYLGSWGGTSEFDLAATIDGARASSRYGASVATAGDVNGDGYSDVAVGSPGYDETIVPPFYTDQGRACVYHGSASGLATASSWSGEGNQANAKYGYSVSTAGDVDGDGDSDIIIGAPDFDNGETNEGRVFVFHGGNETAIPNWTAEGNQSYAYFGYSVSTAGDVNGDGYSDVIIGAYWYDPGVGRTGRAFAYLGSASGLANDPVWTADGVSSQDNFGWAVSDAGDVNGDGYGDVVVGAHGYTNGQSHEGGAFVYHGSQSGLSMTPDWIGEADVASGQYGYSVSTAGDVNRDGFCDLIVSANDIRGGKAFVYLGSLAGLAGAPAWEDSGQGYYGTSVSTAGDVNRDGYSDIIVGDPKYTNGETQEGAAYVYLGSPSGPLTWPHWIGQGNQSYASYGWSVSTAGDVNGDGCSDIIVGAPRYDNGQEDEGKVFVYHGSESSSLIDTDWAPEGDQLQAEFGRSVSTAGDFNGDGFSDVIVGAYLYDSGQSDEGRAFLYFGNDGNGATRRPDQHRLLEWVPIDLRGSSDNDDGFRISLDTDIPCGLVGMRLEWNVADIRTPLNSVPVSYGDWEQSTMSGLFESVENLTSGLPYHWRARFATDSPYYPHSPWFTHSGSVPSEKQIITGPLGTGVELVEESLAPSPMTLGARPNPFNPSTTIHFNLPARTRARLKIYDIAGRVVCTLVDSDLEAGIHHVSWSGRDDDGRQVASGVYFSRLAAGKETATGKMLLIR